jgi:hypothetical protein
MNYINPTFIGSQSLNLNTRANIGDVLTWNITEEGNNDATATYSTDTTFATLTAGNYYQTLAISLSDEAITLKDETFYTLKALNASNEVVYRGKLYSTTQNKESYKVNDDNFSVPNLTNEFIIIE